MKSNELTSPQVVLIVFVDGLLKPNAPGSIQEPARTTLFPDNWSTLPLSFGLIMCKLALLKWKTCFVC